VIIGPGRHTQEHIVSFRAQGLVDENGATIIDPAGGKKTIEQDAWIRRFTTGANLG